VAEDDLRAAAASGAAERAAALRAAGAALADREARWQIVSGAIARVGAASVEVGASTTPAELDAPAAHATLVERLATGQAALAARRTAAAAERDDLHRQVAALEAAGAAIDPELVRLRDELGGELLAGRFEDLDPDDAAWVEARLGPLTGAVIVEDPDAAARSLAASERVLATVWLVRARALPETEPPPSQRGDPRGSVHPFR